MTRRTRNLAAMVSVAGIVACAIAVVGFVRDWARGDLDWWQGFAGRDLYLAAGRGYGKGFFAGFFLAFFLVVLSLAVSSWWEQRRRRRREPDAPAKAAIVAVRLES